MMTRKHKERMRQDEKNREVARKTSLKRNMLLGIMAVIIASGSLAGGQAILSRRQTDDLSGTFVDATGQTENTVQTDGTTADSWNLILVNRDNLLPRTFTVSLTEVGGYRVDVRIKEPLQAMLEAAKQEQIDLLLVSGYRSVSKQRELYNNEVNGNMESGYDQEKSVQLAEQFQQPPGASEHHTGLAVDIISPSYQVLDSGFADTLAGQWLAAHCTEFGFVLRYPGDKENETGILYEPWHFRYVGVEHAKNMQEKGLCLEEYLASL